MLGDGCSSSVIFAMVFFVFFSNCHGFLYNVKSCTCSLKPNKIIVIDDLHALRKVNGL